jgi:Voltage-dependent anion channel
VNIVGRRTAAAHAGRRRAITIKVVRRLGPSAVMATGIVSVDLSHVGWEAVSRALLALAAAIWLLACVRGELGQDFAGVAATAVLGTRLAELGWSAPAWPLLAGAAALWVARLPAWSPHDGSGSDFLVTVATQSLAVLAAALGGEWLRLVGLALCAGGLALYVLTLVRFDLRELLRGAGDQWIAGGALAITALACAELAHHDRALRVASIVLWAAAMAWLPALLAGEALHPRRAGAPARWSTVFPLGMYAAMSFAVSPLAAAGWIHTFARGWTYVAAAAWALVMASAAGGHRGGSGRELEHRALAEPERDGQRKADDGERDDRRIRGGEREREHGHGDEGDEQHAGGADAV